MSEAPRRGRVDVEERLVVAAAELLGEVGPRAMSVRQIAERAGVNHGLVHHYFGGKDGLAREGMKRLVAQHMQWVRDHNDGRPYPVPMGLSGDQKYLRAVVRCVLDGEFDLALTELAEGVSVPRSAMDAVVARTGRDEPDTETRATVAAAMALEMGWAALESFILAVTGTSDDEVDDVRRRVKELRMGLGLRETSLS